MHYANDCLTQVMNFINVHVAGFACLHTARFSIKRQRHCPPQTLPGSTINRPPVSVLSSSITMAKTYTLEFKNSTKESYHFAVYQKFPSSPGLSSIAWQVRGVPPTGTYSVQWELSYGVAITNWDPSSRIYSGQQIQSAQLKHSYEVSTDENGIPSINPKPVGNIAAGTVELKNNTNQKLGMGFTVGGKIIAAERGVHGGESTLFNVHPKYYVACYRAIKEGQLVDEAVEIGPVMVEFKDGYTAYTVEAAVDDGRYYLKKPVPTQ